MEQIDPAADPVLSSRRVLEMVRNLHAMGYERLRICPGMSASGTSWRCTVTPVTNVKREHGASIADWQQSEATYTSGSRDQPFGWADAPGKTVGQLARMFLERFPAIADAGWGPDRAYAVWYREMLEQTKPDRLPYVYADWPTPEGGLPTIGSGATREVIVPLPPAGGAA